MFIYRLRNCKIQKCFSGSNINSNSNSNIPNHFVNLAK